MLTHALRMPNAYAQHVCTRIRVRDSSEKPAVSVANEDLQRIARPRSAAQGTRPKFYYAVKYQYIKILYIKTENQKIICGIQDMFVSLRPNLQSI
jgi:hypothetical protein